MTDRSMLDELPPSIPEDLRAFLDCRVDQATVASGPVTWVEIPANVRGMLGGATHPELTVAPGPGPATAILQVKAGWVKATLPASVVEGRLAIDTSKLPFLAPASIARDIRRFVEEVNDRLAANGKILAPPTFGPDGMTLTKIPRAG